ncbi:anaerobic ribonucleoside-triphosphate reductase activating protein [Candidatus Pacearchaeota archaeon]|nr:anaerobic ribonucleoside-triphosphate reductase activating protein [Candidatus Pacearchaeota archaeon]|tara:strand:- start:12608 stop:13294 length:687 start_codon:yes stop_codon:yes gene_type:complete
MEIAGIEKFSLVDYPGEVCCVLFLKGCNFRCGFCHNPQLVIPQKTPLYSNEKILEFLEKRKNKLTGVCITGGEPLLSIEKNFLRQIKELGYKIKIDTNGSNPNRLKELIGEGLVDYVAMDIKGAKELYKEITNSKVDIEKIEESIKTISKLPGHEFRTTVLKKFHTKKTITSMVSWLKKTIGSNPKAIYLQAFKNTGALLDPKFNKGKNTPESYLKEVSKDYRFIKIR